MGDWLKLSKDKRHRSSSSLAGGALEGTRSERKLDIRASIPEVDDQFALAEARCDDLQEKIELVKGLKKKRKLKKRSMTRVAEIPLPENVPFISVRTQPKKKVSQQAARPRRFELPPNPTRGYLDPATVEQHRMLGQVRGYIQPQEQNTTNKKQFAADRVLPARLRPRRARADGDSVQTSSYNASLEVACGEDDVMENYALNEGFAHHHDDFSKAANKKLAETRLQVKPPPVSRRRHVPRDIPPKEAPKGSNDNVTEEAQGGWHTNTIPIHRRNQQNRPHQKTAAATKLEDSPVVEIFSNYRATTHAADMQKHQTLQSASSTEKDKKIRETQRLQGQDSGLLEENSRTDDKKDKDVHRHPRRVKYRSRRYELPTVASQMKQAGMRYYYGSTNHTNIPFIVSKSTAPSHNIGVNIQQVLNGLKIQQPLSGIPLTIAHHMGLGHIPNLSSKSATVQPSLDNREMNAIRLGRRLLRLPSYKYMSYNRLLSLYREGEGMVPRFLRAISRPHYFYTSMYNLATREDFDGATSKGRGGSQEAKQSLAEYASLYREYEQVEKCIKEGNHEPEVERRRDELTRELASREDHIRRVVQEYRTGVDVDQSTLRASASTAEDGYRHSTFKLNLGDVQP